MKLQLPMDARKKLKKLKIREIERTRAMLKEIQAESNQAKPSQAQIKPQNPKTPKPQVGPLDVKIM